MEHAHGGGPPRARVAAQAAGGPSHARPVARAGHALGGDADPRLPRPGGRVARPAAPGEIQRGSLRPDGPHAAPVRPGQPLSLAARLPGLPGQRQPQPRDARAAQADPRCPGRKPRPKGDAARLGRLRVRHGARRVQARPRSRPALQRRPLLPRRPRARGHAGGDDGAVRGGARGARPGHRRLRGRVLRRHHALGRAGLGGRADASPPRAAASRSRTPTTSAAASTASRPSRRPTTCSATSPRTPSATAASARSR